MEHIDINQFNNWAKNHITDDSKFNDDGYIITENSHNYKSTGIISKIFEDYWDNYYSKYKHILDILRPNADKEVHKVIDCANHTLVLLFMFALIVIISFFLIILVKANFVPPVVLNLKKLKLITFLKNVLMANIDISLLLFLPLFVVGFLMIYLLLIFYLTLFLILYILS